MIYAITCLTKLEKDNLGWPEFGSTAFMGYFENREEATKAVLENHCDISEHCYKYAVIEAIEPGLYSLLRERWFFEFDGKNYFPIKEPDFMKHIANVL